MTLNNRRSTVSILCVTSVPESQISPRVALWLTSFYLRCKAIETWKMHRMKNNLSHLNFKHTLHILSPCQETQIWVTFTLRPAVFEMKIVENRKSSKCTNSLRMTLVNRQIKYPQLYEIKLLVRFVLRPAFIKIKGCRKSQSLENAPNGRLTLKTLPSKPCIH